MFIRIIDCSKAIQDKELVWESEREKNREKNFPKK